MKDRTTIWNRNPSMVLAVVKSGTVLRAVAREDRWIEVLVPPKEGGKGNTGFVLAAHVEHIAGTPAIPVRQPRRGASMWDPSGDPRPRAPRAPAPPPPTVGVRGFGIGSYAAVPGEGQLRGDLRQCLAAVLRRRRAGRPVRQAVRGGLVRTVQEDWSARGGVRRRGVSARDRGPRDHQPDHRHRRVPFPVERDCWCRTRAAAWGRIGCARPPISRTRRRTWTNGTPATTRSAGWRSAVSKWVFTAFEVQYTSVPDALGIPGVSGEFGKRTWAGCRCASRCWSDDKNRRRRLGARPAGSQALPAASACSALYHSSVRRRPSSNDTIGS